MIVGDMKGFDIGHAATNRTMINSMNAASRPFIAVRIADIRRVVLSFGGGGCRLGGCRKQKFQHLVVSIVPITKLQKVTAWIGFPYSILLPIVNYFPMERWKSGVDKV